MRSGRIDRLSWKGCTRTFTRASTFIQTCQRAREPRARWKLMPFARQSLLHNWLARPCAAWLRTCKRLSPMRNNPTDQISRINLAVVTRETAWRGCFHISWQRPSIFSGPIFDLALHSHITKELPDGSTNHTRLVGSNLCVTRSLITYSRR